MDIQKKKGGLFMTVAVNQWGNSLAIRVPQNVVKELQLEKGSELEMVIQDQHIVLKPTKKKFTVEFAMQDMEGKTAPSELFAEIEPKGDEII